MNERGCGGCEGAVPEVDKLAAALVSLSRVGKDFFGFEVEESACAWRGNP